jgi:HEPN domain-containing protein
MVTRTNVGDPAAMTLRWIRWADADYLGARLLLLQGLLTQGAALANTALEKYLKAVCSYAGVKIPHGHAVDVLYGRVKGLAPTNLSLDEGYLRLLRKAYKLRYPDELDKDFNIALNEAKLLSQLDRSVLEITQRFQITMGDKVVAMVLDEAKHKHDERFLRKNVALDPAQSAALFSERSYSYDFRIYKGTLYQVSYQSLRVADDFVFEVEGFTSQSDTQFMVAYPPMIDS